MKVQPYSTRPCGLTLIELLIVITVMLVLVGMLLVVANEVRMRARITVTTNRMEQVLTGIQQVRSEGGSAALGLIQGPLGMRLTFGSMREVLGELKNTTRWPGNLFSQSGQQPPNLRYRDHAGDYRDEARVTWFPGDRYPSYIGEDLDATLELMPWPELSPTRPDKAWYRTRWPVAWPASDWDQATPGVVPVVWGSPWGRAAWQMTSATVAGNPVTYANGDLATTSDPHTLAELSPLATLALLATGGVLTDGFTAAHYRSDRDPNRPWNDAWGNPLVLASAAYVPNRHDVKNAEADMNYRSVSRPRDFLLSKSLQQHGFRAAVYLSIGSVGPAVNATDIPGVPSLTAAMSWSAADDALALRGLWNHIRTTCRASEWTQDSFAKPAWEGLRRIKQSNGFCLLMAPVDIQ